MLVTAWASRTCRYHLRSARHPSGARSTWCFGTHASVIQGNTVAELSTGYPFEVGVWFSAPLSDLLLRNRRCYLVPTLVLLLHTTGPPHVTMVSPPKSFSFTRMSNRFTRSERPESVARTPIPLLALKVLLSTWACCESRMSI